MDSWSISTFLYIFWTGSDNNGPREVHVNITSFLNCVFKFVPCRSFCGFWKVNFTPKRKKIIPFCSLGYVLYDYIFCFMLFTNLQVWQQKSLFILGHTFSRIKRDLGFFFSRVMRDFQFRFVSLGKTWLKDSRNKIQGFQIQSKYMSPAPEVEGSKTNEILTI